MLELDTPFGRVTMVDEPTYSFGSADNVTAYPFEIRTGDYPASCHGVSLDGAPRAVLSAGGGATGVHAHSAVVWRDQLIVAVGSACFALALPSFELRWSLEADMVTCFGLHLSAAPECLIVHGELCVSRLGYEGELVWQTPGRDIFTGDLSAKTDWIEVEDFNEDRYRLGYDGQILRGPRR